MRRGPIISFLSIIHEWIFGKSILFGRPPKKEGGREEDEAVILSTLASTIVTVLIFPSSVKKFWS